MALREDDAQPVKILLVDDDPANLLALRAVLDDQPGDVMEARSGAEALGLLEQHEFALILLDVQMEGLDGFETARRIRDLEHGRHTPIIFMTAHEENRLHLERAYTHGAVDYLFKPLVPRILRSKVEVFAELFRQRQQIQEQAERLRLLERQEAERALTASEARKAAILDSSLDGIVTINGQGLIVEFNPGAERIFGYRRGQAVGREMASLLIPERLRQRHRRGLARYFATGESTILDRPLEMPALKSDGQEVPVEMTIIRLPTEGPPLFTGFVRDISARKRGEQRRAAQLAVSQALAGAATAAEALIGILQAVGESLQWDAGAIWQIDPLARAQELRCLEFWHSPKVQVPRFEAESRRRTYVKGIGLPGRVWATEQPAWIPDVVPDANFPRAHIAQQEGLHAAFGFPIRAEGQTVGVIEFFSQAIQQPDDDLMALMAGFGIHVGQFLERKRVEEERRASEQRFTRFMQHLPGLAWIKDLQGRYIYVNDAAARAFCKTRAELYGKNDEEIFPPATAAQFRDNDQRALASGTGIETVETLEHDDGMHYSVVSKFPIPGPDGQPFLIGGMAIDITERKQAEAALRESESRFRSMANNAPVLIWVNGVAGCEFVNREYLRFVGRTFKEVGGMKWKEFLHPDDAPDYLERYAQAFQQRQPFEASFRFRRADGEYRWLRSAGVPRFTEAGRYLGFVGCSVDITEIKKSEELLKDADRRKDEFLATLAHELRNPLAPIRNALHMLRLVGREGPTPHVIEMMDRQVNHMVRLVDDLMEVSRITRGKIELRKELVELAPILRSAVETARPLLEAAGHQLIVDLPAEPLWLAADAMRLTQVVANLLNNAAKYTESAGTIWLNAQRAASQVVISVRDTGVGIPAEMLPRVFDMFTQIDRNLGRSQGGLGIGLTLVKQLVEMHGGSVESRSEGPGKGSEFLVRLPLAVGPEQGLANGQGASVSTVQLPRRVLIVDDNRDAADSLAVLLRFLANEVEVAYDGAAALACVRSFRPSVVFLDIGMPGMDGYEVARHIRQSEPPDLVLIALTGWGQEEDRRRSLAAGFDYHLVKPIAPAELESLLASLHKSKQTT